MSNNNHEETYSATGAENGSDRPLGVILLATQPRMMRQMMRRVLQKMPGPWLVLEAGNMEQVPGILERVDADWLITSLTDDDQLPEPLRSVVEQKPSLSVMGISEDGSHVVVSETGDEEIDKVEPQSALLEDATLAQLLELIDRQTGVD
jgi:DNA-binding NarL/FixJ family response regulator